MNRALGQRLNDLGDLYEQVEPAHTASELAYVKRDEARAGLGEVVRMSKKPWNDFPQIASSEITPELVWLNRRNLMKAAAAGAGALLRRLRRSHSQKQLSRSLFQRPLTAQPSKPLRT